MATVTENRTHTTTAIGEHRIIIRDVGWHGYQSLLKMIGNQRVRVTYDRGDVELVSPLLRHERNSSLLGQYVRVLTRELQIPVMPARSTTLDREDLDRGLEADESFYLGDLERVRNLRDLDLTVDPPPDLVIEIEITRSVLNRLGVYGALGVPEIWRFNGQQLQVLIRQPDGQYIKSDQSLAFPGVPMEEIARFASMEEIRDENVAVSMFCEWLRNDLLPKLNDSANP